MGMRAESRNVKFFAVSISMIILRVGKQNAGEIQSDGKTKWEALCKIIYFVKFTLHLSPPERLKVKVKAELLTVYVPSTTTSSSLESCFCPLTK